jgi:hypothetical protein
MDALVRVNTVIDVLISENTMLRNKIVDLEQRLGISINPQPCYSKDLKANESCLDKGKSVVVNDFVNPKSKTSSRKQTSIKFVPTCYQCEESGHIRPKCPLLRSSRPRIRRIGPKGKEFECDT